MFGRLSIAAALAIPLVCHTLPAQSSRGRTTAFINASVVDVEQGRILPNHTVLVAGDRILSVTPSASTRIPAGAEVVNIAGRFVIPGLWDMHVHQLLGALYDSLSVRPEARREGIAYFSALFLATGVTGVREMGGDLAALQAADSAAQRAGTVRPRMVLTGEKIGNRPVVPGAPFPVASALDVRRSVQLVRTAGASHAKLGVQLTPDLVRVALEACRSEGIPCLGHAPPAGMTIAEVSAQGQRSVEHLFGFAEETSSLGRPHIAAWREELAAPTLLQRVGYKLHLRRRPSWAIEDSILATYDSTAAALLFRQLASAGTWVTPTLTLSEQLRPASEPDSMARNPALLIDPPAAAPSDGPSQAARSLAIRTRALNHRMIRGLLAAGVGLLAGTDIPRHDVPGFSLHRELVLLQEAGLTPLQSLRTATLEPARYLNGTDSLGSVAAGKVADLVVLRKNPLVDVRSTREIDMVMTRGRLLRRQQLDSLVAAGRVTLGRLRAAVGRPRQASP